MPKSGVWTGSHSFDLCLRNTLKATVRKINVEVYDFDVERIPYVPMKVIIVMKKIKLIQPNLIMFFDEFSQWNVGILDAIRKDKEITNRSFQIFSYPKMSLVLSNFSG